MRTVVCGKGRLGLLIVSALQQQGACCEHARIDAQRGLVDGDKALAGSIDTLILCFVPKHTEGKSGWQGLLRGLLEQVQTGALHIGRVLFIGSTAATGGDSIRSQGLLDAEGIIPKLAPASAIFRLTGLVGPGYLKYDPLSYSMDRPRQAVDTRVVAAEVLRWFSEPQNGHRIEVLTDGFVYWQGKQLRPEKDAQEIETLGKKFHLPKPTRVCRQRT